MPTIEGVCGCKCAGCQQGKHCGILDNDCIPAGLVEKPLTDEDMLREDEIRASAGLFDFDGLSGSSLSPFDDEDEGDEDEED
jgi:hypothetical protein